MSIVAQCYVTLLCFYIIVPVTDHQSTSHREIDLPKIIAELSGGIMDQDFSAAVWSFWL
jgi:hypothetical protein